MKKLSYAAWLSLTILSAARAQTVEIGGVGGYPRWGRVPLGSISSEGATDTDTRIRGEYTWGGSVTLNTKGYYGFELGYLQISTELKTTVQATVDEQTVTTLYQDRVKVHVAYLNALVYFMPRGERWRPFITGGMQGYQWSTPHIPDWPDGQTRHWGVNVGGGLKLRLFPHTLVRWDFRDYMGGKPYATTFVQAPTFSNGVLHRLEGTMGFSITF